uniref:Uncharacterized protein n=1 Tax=Aplanochytrium stocchinoi TaxID=215587 RepID=A0A7S3PDB5_9STRA
MTYDHEVVLIEGDLYPAESNKDNYIRIYASLLDYAWDPLDSCYCSSQSHAGDPADSNFYNMVHQCNHQHFNEREDKSLLFCPKCENGQCKLAENMKVDNIPRPVFQNWEFFMTIEGSISGPGMKVYREDVAKRFQVPKGDPTSTCWLNNEGLPIPQVYCQNYSDPLNSYGFGVNAQNQRCGLSFWFNCHQDTDFLNNGLHTADINLNLVPCPSTPKPTASPSIQHSTCSYLSDSDGELDAEGVINVIMVGSAFNRDNEAFVLEATKIFDHMEEFPPLNSTDIDRLNILMVTKDLGDFCYFNCGDIPRLLCCDTSKAAELADECGSGIIREILVIHNDPTYGGSGGQIATTSIHPLSKDIAVHEFGHSIFGLGDEYNWPPSTSMWSPNCANAGCGLVPNAYRLIYKWKDLIDHPYNSVYDVRCTPGKCGDNAYFADGHTIMCCLGGLGFGISNERITCCHYGFPYPSYCKKFNGLENYCNDLVAEGFVDLGSRRLDINQMEMTKQKLSYHVIHGELRSPYHSRMLNELVNNPNRLVLKYDPSLRKYQVESIKKLTPGTFSHFEIHGDKFLPTPLRKPLQTSNMKKLIIKHKNKQLFEVNEWTLVEVPPDQDQDNSILEFDLGYLEVRRTEILLILDYQGVVKEKDIKIKTEDP